MPALYVPNVVQAPTGGRRTVGRTFNRTVAVARTRVRDRVLRLREALLIQMDEFEMRLESELRRLLDPVVAAPIPVRRKLTDLRRTDYALGPGYFVPETLVPVPAALRR